MSASWDPIVSVPEYGQDPRWDALYDAMGHDQLWHWPAPRPLWDWLGPRWFDLPMLPWLWRRVLEPIRFRVAWWWYTRWHRYPTERDWLHD